MGDHVCGGASEPTPPLDLSANFEKDMSFRKNPGGGGLLKAGRMPPRVDTSAANRPYFRQDQLTPVSASSDSRSISPRTPNDGRKSPFGKSLRVALSSSLPSPEILTSNLDNAFPPFPAGKPTNQGPRRIHSENKDSDPMYAPRSPRIETVGLLQRMNSIAPGPFDINGKRPARSQTERRPQKNQQQEETKFPGHIQQPSMSSSIHSQSSKGSNARGIQNGSMMSKMDRPGGYGGFGQLLNDEEEPKKLEGRSQTFPTTEERIGSSLPRRPSEPGGGLRRPSNVGMDPRMVNGASPPSQRRPSTSGPDRSRAPPPRGVSLIGGRNGEIIPPMPSNLNLAAEFGVGNPYHTPSISQSSNESGRSANGTASSQSSPPSARNLARRKPSETATFDSLMKDLESSMKDGPSQPSTAPREQLAKPLAKVLAPSMLSPESPMDPAIQGGRLSPLPGRRPSTERVAHRRPATAKGDCKACGKAIKGKSVSSADGRLTGRYHKECFVCTTCSEPFATSTFYVLKDAPYCDRHYHKLNNSCCFSCDKGIEGQYLETERRQKYHPTCLTCSDCRRVLEDDYFEMNGRVYCERDAYRKAQQRNFLGPGSTNRMERRTTRLMIM